MTRKSMTYGNTSYVKNNYHFYSIYAYVLKYVIIFKIKYIVSKITVTKVRKRRDSEIFKFFLWLIDFSEKNCEKSCMQKFKRKIFHCLVTNLQFYYTVILNFANHARIFQNGLSIFKIIYFLIAKYRIRRNKKLYDIW